MQAGSPREVSEAFAAAINAGEISAAVELWSDDAALVAIDGTKIQGREAIKQALERLVANSTRVEIELKRIYQTDLAALGTGTLTLRSTGSDGEEITHHADSIVVYARDQRGAWRVAIDFPWGVPVEHAPGGEDK